jgi:hypothetical protein
VRIPGTLYERIPVRWTVIDAVPVSQYLCRDCGYLERWIDSPADRERLAARYPPAGGGGGS